MQKLKNKTISFVFPLISLAVFFVVSILVKNQMYSINDERLEARLSSESNSVLATTKEKLNHYDALLHAIRSYFSISPNLTRQEWAQATQLLNLKKNYTSLLALGYARRVPKVKKEAFLDSQHADKSIQELHYPQFELHSENNDEDYYVVDFIEPIKGNETVFGYDLFSNSARKKALEIARDTNSISITEPIRLVQEKEGQQSILLILPVYEGNEQIIGLEERRKKNIGFVVASLRAPSFFSEIVLSTPLLNINGFSVSDVTSKPQTLLSFMNIHGDLDKSAEAMYPEIQKSRLNVGTRVWEFSFKSSKKVIISGMDWLAPYLIILIGIFVSVFEHLRIRGSVRKSEQLLLLEEERLGSMIQGSDMGVWEWNVQTGKLTVNERWAEILGYTLDELTPFTIDKAAKFIHADDLTMAKSLLQKHFEGADEYYEAELRVQHKNGTWIWVLDRGKVLKWTQDKKPLLMYGSRQDITNQKKSEQKLRDTVEELEKLNKYMVGREMKMAELKRQMKPV